MSKIQNLINEIIDRIDNPRAFTKYISKLLVPKCDIKAANDGIIVIETKPLYPAIRHFEKYVTDKLLIDHLNSWLA